MTVVTKKELIRIVRDVISGRSGHTIGNFRRIKRGKWEVETTIGNQYPFDSNSSNWANFRYDRNEMTLKEAKEYIDA